MKVLIVFSSSQLGGAERSLSRMALASSDIEYRLATIKAEGPWCEWVRSEGKEPLVFGTDRSHGDGGMLGAMVRLLLYLRAHPVDAVYVCGVRASFWLRLFRFSIPSTKLVHGVRWNPISKSRLDRFFRLIERATNPLIDAWITNSKAAKDTLIEQCGIAGEHVHVIYNGVDTLPDVLPNFNDRSLEVLTVANLNPRKGHREYLQVIQAVVRRVPGAHFVFVGRDDMKGAIQEAIEEADLDAYVSYEGFQQDISPFLRSARVFVLPSIWGEGCPTSILEAFSFALPVIAHGIDGVPELIDNKIDGYVVQPHAPALANLIEDLLLDSLKAKEMGMRGRKKIADRFTKDTCAREHMNVFCRVVDK